MISGDMPMPLFRRILETAPKSVRVIKIQGLGEPTLHKNFEDLMRLANETGASVHITTNGMSLRSAAVRAALLKYASVVTISIDSLDKKKASELRRGTNLDRLACGLKKLLSERDSRTGPEIGINFTASSENFDETSNVAAFGRQIGINFISVVEFENWDSSGATKDSFFKEAANSVPKFHAALVRQVLKLRLQLIFSGIAIGFKPGVSEKRLGRCLWPYQGLYVTAKGTVTPCCTRVLEIHGVGSLDTSTLDEIWNGSAYEKLRECHQLLDFTDALCGTCPG